MMTSLTDDPRYISRFEQEAKPPRQAGLHQSLRISQPTSNNARAHSPFRLFQWHRGEWQSLYFELKFFLSDVKLNYRATSNSGRDTICG